MNTQGIIKFIFSSDRTEGVQLDIHDINKIWNLKQLMTKDLWKYLRTDEYNYVSLVEVKISHLANLWYDSREKQFIIVIEFAGRNKNIYSAIPTYERHFADLTIATSELHSSLFRNDNDINTKQELDNYFDDEKYTLWSKFDV
jgi:hypothetical protein